MQRDYEDLTKVCAGCQLNQSIHNSNTLAPQMHPLEPPGIPFYRWGIDFVQDLPRNPDGFTQIITCIDYATRFVVAKAVKNRTAKTVAEFLFNEILLKFGAPNEILSDRASSFMSNVLQEYLDLQRIHHYPSTPYHPQSNGMVERMHGVMGPMITKSCEGMPSKWPLFIPTVVFALNARCHTVTGQSPFKLVYGFSPRLPGMIEPPFVFNLRDDEDAVLYTRKELESLGQSRAAALWRSQKQADRLVSKDGQDPKKTSECYAVGSFVKVFNHNATKFENKWTGPFIVERLGPNQSYYLKASNGLELKNPVNQVNMAPFVSLEDLSGSNFAET
jgi:transposase InsO family protein